MVHVQNKDFRSMQGGFMEKTKGGEIKHSDAIVFEDATAGVIISNLPQATGWGGKKIFIKKTDSSSNKITIKPKPGSGETIDGKTSIDIINQYDYYHLCSDGSNWMIISASQKAIVKTMTDKILSHGYATSVTIMLNFMDVDTNGSNVQQIMLGNGRIVKAKLYIKTNTRDAIAVLTLRKNSVDTGITITIPALSSVNVDSVGDAVEFEDGDLMSWYMPSSGTVGSTIFNGSTQIEYDD